MHTVQGLVSEEARLMKEFFHLPSQVYTGG